MLQLIKFSTAHAGQKELLSKTSLNIDSGQKIALLGYNGVGKSSIIKSIWEKFVINDASVVADSNFAYLPQNIPDLDFNTQNIKDYPDYYQLFYNWQSQENSHKSVYNDFDDNLFYWSLSAIVDKKFQQRLNSNLFDLNISPGLIADNFRFLSPGTKKKILLSILFATNPDIMVLDELTNHLDKNAISTVSGWMEKYKGTVLIVDHNSDFLEKNISNFLFLPNNEERQFEKYYNISFGDFMNLRDDLREKQKAQVKTIEKREKKLKAQLKLLQFRAEVFDADIGAAAGAVKRRLKNEVENSDAYKNQDLRKSVGFLQSADKSKVKKYNLISIKNLKYKIGEKPSQHIEEFKIYNGQRIWLTGGNGKGKSSLMNLIVDKIDGKMEKNDQYISGDVTIGSSMSHENYFVLRQNTDYAGDLTIIKYTDQFFKLEWYKINSILKKCGLGDKFDFESNISHLSLGEFIRYQLAILSANLRDIDLIILDEPGNFLDIFTQQALVDLIGQYNGALLYITHDESLGDKFDPDEKFDLQ